MAVALEGDVSAVSDAQIEATLQGQPDDVVDEVTRINREARNRALWLALASMAVIGLVGFGASLLLPPNTLASSRLESESRRST